MKHTYYGRLTACKQILIDGQNKLNCMDLKVNIKLRRLRNQCVMNINLMIMDGGFLWFGNLF